MVNMKRFNGISNPLKKVLFLGFNEKQTSIIKALIKNNCLVDQTDSQFNITENYNFVVCFGYRYIIKQSTIDKLGCPIFNLHISYLPYNRGAHPNFWSFYDKTPAGVSIHLIDSGLDTGPIVWQRLVNFKKEDDTFLKTYKVLIKEIENLFIEHLHCLLNDDWIAREQNGSGSHHYVKDLPHNFSGWTSNITEEITKLKHEGLKYE